MSLISFIRLFAFKRYVLLTVSISLNREIISLYSYYTKKGLVYITIIDPFSRQPFSYTKYTKLNTCILYDVRLVSLNKCTFPYCVYYYA